MAGYHNENVLNSVPGSPLIMMRVRNASSQSVLQGGAVCLWSGGYGTMIDVMSVSAGFTMPGTDAFARNARYKVIGVSPGSINAGATATIMAGGFTTNALMNLIPIGGFLQLSTHSRGFLSAATPAQKTMVVGYTAATTTTTIQDKAFIWPWRY